MSKFRIIFCYPKIICRIQNRMGLRIQELQNLPMNMPPHLRIQAEIELRALRLVNLQTQVWKYSDFDFVPCMHRRSEFCFN